MGTLRNARHEIFAQGLADGKSQERAYIDAGYSAKGARGSANSLLKQKPEIYERVRELLAEKSSIRLEGLKQAAEKVGVDKAWVLRQLVQNVQMAKAAEPVLDADGNPVGEYKQNLQAANRALELIGKELGMFIERKAVRHGGLDDLDIEESRQALEFVRAAIAKARQTA